MLNTGVTAEELLKELRSGEISAADISKHIRRLPEEELTKFVDLLLRWTNPGEAVAGTSSEH